jgi:hypothetical protein
MATTVGTRVWPQIAQIARILKKEFLSVKSVQSVAAPVFQACGSVDEALELDPVTSKVDEQTHFYVRGTLRMILSYHDFRYANAQ